jgi:hypothetical protein
MSKADNLRTQILDLVKEYHTAKFAPKTFDPDKDLVHYAVYYPRFDRYFEGGERYADKIFQGS